MGSGKSTLSQSLRKLGYPVADCDAISREILQPQEKGWQRCIETFGRGILTADNEIDRRALAELVFQDDQKRLQLEAITHPLIIERLRQEAAEAEGPLWFAEVPLLFETGLETEFDEIITVSAPLELIYQRLQQGRGISREEAQARLQRQMPQDEKIRRSTFSIVNDGDLAAMEHKIRAWIGETTWN